uniref:EF-hand domain-containing protein n=1 Tax=Lotharella oceanica TaxID=641309 RepID=A0A7S2TEI5_9EUKA|mmetsp:Transcript_10291/g.19750  ORF Transcript_10291/g.19750 Transcript_10291/m.19750 type:complete len:507 (+) Transcript_10291:85-1605(+)
MQGHKNSQFRMWTTGSALYKLSFVGLLGFAGLSVFSINASSYFSTYFRTNVKFRESEMFLPQGQATKPVEQHWEVISLPEGGNTTQKENTTQGFARMFAKLDLNGDGYLTEDEASEAQMINWDVQAEFRAADADRDGKVTMEEFSSQLHSRAQDKPSEPPKQQPEPEKKNETPKKEGGKNRRKKKKRPPPYPTYPPPHSPEAPPQPQKFPKSITESKNRRHIIFTVDNRDVRGKGYRPFVAAANQHWASTMTGKGVEKHEYYYIRSNLSCSITDCPTFPKDQVNKICCTGPVPNLDIPEAIRGTDPIKVHPSWMDLKGVRYVMDNLMEEGDIGVYLDSDAHFDFNKGKTFREAFEWMVPEFFDGTKPIAIYRDRSHWTAVSGTDFGGPYAIDANSGLIMFTKNQIARDWIERLWQSALVVSPQEKRFEIDHYYQFGWPHEQERLTWFASTPAENASIAYIRRMGWQVELPWCFQVICHRNFDKMPYIEKWVKGKPAHQITQHLKIH